MVCSFEPLNVQAERNVPTRLAIAASAYVPKYEHRSQQNSLRISDGCSAVIDGDSRSIFRNQQSVANAVHDLRQFQKVTASLAQA
jgi:hypothetical protein